MSILLPPPPAITAELVEDLSPADAAGFLRLRRRRFRICYPDGSRSAPMMYDSVQRRGIDAATVLVYHMEDGEPSVYLRSCPRLGLLRDGEEVDVNLWELPAGIMETGEEPIDCAVRELEEELGFAVPAERFEALGPAMCPASGMIAEKVYFFAVKVASAERRTPSLDGSPLEEGAAIIVVPLSQALAAADAGELPDAKTELALRRFERRWRA